MEVYWFLLILALSGRLQVSRRRWHRTAWNFAWYIISVPNRSLLSGEKRPATAFFTNRTLLAAKHAGTVCALWFVN